jgi:prepilin-type N-terminal cleavage/methylation domain-containing protein
MRHGFTLIELVLVVAIIAMMAVIAVPRLASAQTGSRFSGAERRMQSEFAAVGELAAAEGRAHTIQFHIPSGEMRVYRGTVLTAPSLVRSIAFADEPYRASIVATNITGGGATVLVDGFGMYSAEAKIQIAIGSDVRVVNLSGPVAGSAVKTEDVDGGGLLGGLIDSLLGGLILPAVAGGGGASS